MTRTSTRRRLSPADFARSAAAAYLGFALCMGVLAVVPETYTREPAAFAEASSRFVKQHRGKSNAASAIGDVGGKLHGTQSVPSDAARRAYDSLAKPTRSSHQQRIPTLPFRIAVGLVGLICLGMGVMRTVQAVLLAYQPQPASS